MSVAFTGVSESVDTPRHRVPTSTAPSGRRAVPTHAELASWRSFLRAHATITKTLEAELEIEQQLSLAAYDVLVQLSEAPERRLRMTELADAVLLSRSGVTRLVDRLEKVGLVARSRVADDGRGVAAELTEAGSVPAAGGRDHAPARRPRSTSPSGSTSPTCADLERDQPEAGPLNRPSPDTRRASRPCLSRTGLSVRRRSGRRTESAASGPSSASWICTDSFSSSPRR